MFLQRTILLAALLLMVSVSSTQVLAQGPATPRTKSNKIVFDGKLGALLPQLADKFHVNMSLETDPAQPEPNVKIDLWFDTLDEILDGIAVAVPVYRWKKHDGFIDVYPQERASLLLETVVGDFRVENDEWLSVSQALTSAPEVVNEMKTLGLIRRDYVRRKPAVTQFSLDLRNVTLRRALHEITMKSNNRFWMFQRYGQDGRFFSISTSL